MAGCKIYLFFNLENNIIFLIYSLEKSTLPADLCFLFSIQCPLNDVPKMPTASSAQISNRPTSRATHKIIRQMFLFIFLKASSHNRPVESNRVPATTKSNRVQFTSFVSCIAIAGINNRIAESIIIIISFLFCIIKIVLINFTLLIKLL